MYVVAAILRNALACMQSNNTSMSFDLDSPTVEEYFSSIFTKLFECMKY